MQGINEGKTVYVLGAGFSIPAGAPPQGQIMRRICELRPHPSELKKAKGRFINYLKKVVGVSKKMAPGTALEDVYTPMDRCISDDLWFKGTTPSKLSKIREDLEYLIAESIDKAIDENSQRNREYIPRFAKYLVDKAGERKRRANETSADRPKSTDLVSVISLNWDILLDRAIYEAIGETQTRAEEENDYSPIGVVDYCCYISSIESNNKRIRSGLWALGAGGYNVKLLKIHGSMNWLQCPNCQRLFTAFNEKECIAIRSTPKKCRHCEKAGHVINLRSSLVMPTFLKDLSNFQIKLIWQNAGVEIMEATKIVFIGYSLPQADFEFRNLLSRMKRKEARIVVILNTETDNKVEQQYNSFFAGHSVDIRRIGVVEYVNSLTTSSTLTPAPPAN